MSSKKIDPRFQFQQRTGYKSHPKKMTRKSNPDYFIKVTEPGQVISVKKLVERYEKQNRRRQSDFGVL